MTSYCVTRQALRFSKEESTDGALNFVVDQPVFLSKKNLKLASFRNENSADFVLVNHFTH